MPTKNKQTTIEKENTVVTLKFRNGKWFATAMSEGEEPYGERFDTLNDVRDSFIRRAWNFWGLP